MTSAACRSSWSPARPSRLMRSGPPLSGLGRWSGSTWQRPRAWCAGSARRRHWSIPAEIEQRLITHPAVADVGVVGVPHPDWGHQPVAVVQLEDGWAGGEQLAAELDAYCRSDLASLKCPGRYEFRESLPRTHSGKLLRRVLREELTGS